MKRTAIYLLVGIVLTLGLVSCNKDEHSQIFKASTEKNDSKTYLDTDGMTIKWSAGDQIMISGSGNTGNGQLYQVLDGAGTTTATFAYAGTGTEANLHEPYLAIYPASIYDPSNTTTYTGTSGELYIIIPATQTYVEGGMMDFPMVACSNSRTLNFKNICGVIKIHATKPNTNISRITISTNKVLNGRMKVTSTSSPNCPTAYREGNSTITLVCTTPQSINNGRDFYIYLPYDGSGSFSTFEISLYTDDNRVCTKRAHNSITVSRSRITTINLSDSDLGFDEITGDGAPSDAINGRFTINNQGRQVYFAKGNLQYVNNTWQFAEHQYDYLGTYSGTAWDLFGPSTDGNFGMNTSTDPNDYAGTFVDWGTNIGSGQSWYTLSNTEWTYLLNNNGRRIGGATITVDGVAIRGVVLLPDVFNGPAFTTGYSFTQNNYTPESWAAMEEAGAVFLPLAGYREGSDVTADQNQAYYWTNTPATYRKMGSQSGSWSWTTRTGTDGTYKGFAVRLVHDAN